MTQFDVRVVVQDIELFFEPLNYLLMIGIQVFVDGHLINLSDCPQILRHLLVKFITEIFSQLGQSFLRNDVGHTRTIVCSSYTIPIGGDMYFFAELGPLTRIFLLQKGDDIIWRTYK